MKRIITTISILLGLAISVMGATKTLNKPVTPNPTEFSNKLVAFFGGKDQILDKDEMTKVLAFLQANLPEKTAPTTLSARLNRESNIRNTPRGDMTEERHALREYKPDQYVGKFIRKYDLDGDSALTGSELAFAMSKMIGLPSTSQKWSKRAIVKR